MKRKLKISMIPTSTYGDNVRSLMKPEEWNILRSYIYAKAGYICEICGDKGTEHPVECHEVWKLLYKTKKQKLVRLESLCPMCHKVIHFGRTSILGEYDEAVRHLRKVNKWSDTQAFNHIDKKFIERESISRVNWKVDISFAINLLKKIRKEANVNIIVEGNKITMQSIESAASNI